MNVMQNFVGFVINTTANNFGWYESTFTYTKEIHAPVVEISSL